MLKNGTTKEINKVKNNTNNSSLAFWIREAKNYKEQGHSDRTINNILKMHGCPKELAMQTIESLN